MILCSIKSKSLGFYNQPFCVNSPEEALYFVQSNVRAGKDAGFVNSLDDMELIQIADFDQKTGKIKATDRTLCLDLTRFLPKKEGEKK